MALLIFYDRAVPHVSGARTHAVRRLKKRCVGGARDVFGNREPTRAASRDNNAARFARNTRSRRVRVTYSLVDGFIVAATGGRLN